MTPKQYGTLIRALSFALALVLGVCALLVVIPLLQSRTSALPDPLLVGDKAYALKDDEPREGAIDWNAWYAINPDLVAWLSIPSINVSLPIVQAHQENPEYYLNHDIYRNENIYGCPYLDAGCERDGIFSKHVVISGHSLTDGSMFTPLLAYADEQFALDHNEIILYTPKAAITYEVRRATIIDGSEQQKRIAFASDDDFYQWLIDEDTRALYVLDNSPAAKGLTLVTCSYSVNPDNERLILFCTPQAPHNTTIPITEYETSTPKASVAFATTIEGAATLKIGTSQDN